MQDRAGGGCGEPASHLDSTRSQSRKSAQAVNARRPLFVLLVAATLVRAALLGRPFVADDEGTACGPLLCLVRNYLRYGPLATGFGGVMNTGTVPADRWVIYAHHPPLVPLLIAGWQRIAGISEWTARAIPALFSLANTAALYLMAERRFGVRAAVSAGVLYAFCPLTLLFGGMPEYVGAQLVFFGLATIESYVRWVETGRVRWLAALTIAFFLGALTDWPIFYLVPVLSGHYLLTRPRRGIVSLVPLLAAASLLFVALVLWAQAVSAGREYWTATGGDFSFLQKLAVRTLGHPDSDDTPLSVRRWVARVLVRHEGVLHGGPMLALAAVYATLAARRVARRDWAALDRDRAPLLVMTWGALHLGVGLQGNFQHAWWSVVLTPGLALAAALGLEDVLPALAQGLDRRRSVATAAIATSLLMVLSAGLALVFSADWKNRESPGYTLKGLGSAIQSVAQPEEGVLTSETNGEPALWFYADRQLRPAITSVEQFAPALAAGAYALYYGYQQPTGPAPRWFVMPAAQRPQLATLAATLDARFPRYTVDGFIVHRLY